MKDLNIRDDAKDCPNCFEDILATVDTYDAETMECKGKKVACFSCGALGPLGADLEEAIRLWNGMVAPVEFIPVEDEEGDQ